MKEDGFTLIEALVSLVLGAMVLAAVLSTVRVAAHGADRARAAAQDSESFARADTVLSGDMAHALWIGDDSGHPLFQGQPDVLRVVESPRPLNLGALPSLRPRPPVMVTYQLGMGEKGVLLSRSEASIAGGAVGPALPIFAAPGRLEFRYLDARGGWLRAWTDATSLPRAVAVADPANGQPQLVAALPDLLPLACSRGPGPACPLPGEAFP